MEKSSKKEISGKLILNIYKEPSDTIDTVDR